MEDEVMEVQLKRSDSFGYGFSVFGGKGSGFPPVIYDVVENSPAAANGVLEAGDVILEVNDKKVVSLTTKEVLKCLRLSNDVVTLKVKKDTSIKDRVYKHMTHSNELEALRRSYVKEIASASSNGHGHMLPTENHTNDDAKENDENIPPYSPLCEPLSPQGKKRQTRQQQKFEYFMITGDLIIKKQPEAVVSYGQNSAIPDESDLRFGSKATKREASNFHSPIVEKKGSFSYSGNFVRTSKSEDYLQKVSVSSVNIDIEDDIASSFNTLLDTNKDTPPTDRIVWTYNAPVASPGATSAPSPTSPTSDSSSSRSSCEGSSPDRKSDNSVPENKQLDTEGRNYSHILNSSETGFSTEETCSNSCNLNVSVLVNDKLTNRMFMPHNKQRCPSRGIQPKQDGVTNIVVDENKIYVKVLPDRNTIETRVISVSKSDKLCNSTSPISPCVLKSNTSDEPNFSSNKKQCAGNANADEEFRRCYSPTEDESDVESLRSFHYSPKAIDMPSASRLAKRLYNLEGFKKSDVSRHLCKNNDFSRVVAEEYLKFFEFIGEALDVALRKFLKQFCLIGETQERERVLVHFSKWYLDCNPGAFKSQDAVHTLTCALMLLNTDLHGENVGRRMTCGEFVENLAELNEGENFPKDVLKSLYHSIKSLPLEWAVDDEEESSAVIDDHISNQDLRQSFIGHNPFLEVPNPNCATEYKKGYMMRKCCVDPNGKKTPIGKRGWKMFHATLRDLVLYLHKDENGFRKNQLYDSLHNSIRIHHALATKATDYTKKRNVFRLQTADQAEYLFQTRYLKDANQDDSKELQSWIDTINYVAASLSAPPLAGGIGSSQKKFQRPLLPVSHTKLNFREQLLDIESSILHLDKEVEEHLSQPPDRSAKSRIIHEFVEKEAFLQFELKRYRTYAFLLHSKMMQFPELEPPLVETSIGEVDEPLEKYDQTNSPVCTLSNAVFDNSNVKRSLSDRYSYRAAIYKTGASEGGV